MNKVIKRKRGEKKINNTINVTIPYKYRDERNVNLNFLENHFSKDVLDIIRSIEPEIKLTSEYKNKALKEIQGHSFIEEKKNFIDNYYNVKLSRNATGALFVKRYTSLAEMVVFKYISRKLKISEGLLYDVYTTSNASIYKILKDKTFTHNNTRYSIIGTFKINPLTVVKQLIKYIYSYKNKDLFKIPEKEYEYRFDKTYYSFLKFHYRNIKKTVTFREYIYHNLNAIYDRIKKKKLIKKLSSVYPTLNNSELIALYYNMRREIRKNVIDKYADIMTKSDIEYYFKDEDLQMSIEDIAKNEVKETMMKYSYLFND